MANRRLRINTKKLKVINIHRRILNQPKAKAAELLGTLSTREDKIWPFEKWPAMRFRNGLKKGSKGGHGPIRYTVDKYEPNKLIQFKFSRPRGFNGVHRFKIAEKENNKTELKHIIEMNTIGMGTLAWIFAIRWLHDALIEDAFDKAENHFTRKKKMTKWSIWVKILRKVLKSKKSKGNL